MDTKLAPTGVYFYSKDIDINASGDSIEVQVAPPSDMLVPLMFAVVPFMTRGSNEYAPVNLLPWGAGENVFTVVMNQDTSEQKSYKTTVSAVSEQDLTCTLALTDSDAMFTDAHVYILGLR